MNILFAGIVGGTFSFIVKRIQGGNLNLQPYTILLSKVVKLENQLNKIGCDIMFNKRNKSRSAKNINNRNRLTELASKMRYLYTKHKDLIENTISQKITRKVNLSVSDKYIVDLFLQNNSDIERIFPEIENYVFSYDDSIETDIFLIMSKHVINKYYIDIAISLYTIRNNIAYETRTINPDLVNNNTFLDTLSFANINVDIISLKHNTDALMTMVNDKLNFPRRFHIPVAKYCKMRINDINQLTKDDILHLCILIAKSKDASKYFLEADKIRRHFMHVDTNLSHNQIAQLFANFKYCTQMGRIEPYCNERYRNI